MVFVIAGGVIVGGVGLAALYDYRARRRGGRVSVSSDEAWRNPREAQAIVDVSRQDRLGGGV